ncbi:MAG: hypothetical protein V1690_00770 [Candidatus Moraniibacteriota bacterium]
MTDKPKTKKRACPMWRRAIVALLIVIIAAPLVTTADSITPNINNGGWDRSLGTAGNDQLIGLTYSLRTLLWTAGVVLESSQSILTRVADTAFYQDQLGGFVQKKETGMGSAQSGWNWVKGFCNMIIVILLLFIAFGTILRVESYNYKYLLVKLIVVAILVNFSGVIAGIVLDFTHIVMGIFSDQITNIGKSIEENSKILREFTGTADLSDMASVTTSLGDNMTRTISRVNVNLILASVLMFILGITVLAVALFLIVRTVSLWLLFTLSPLALALYVLPHTRVASLKWWDAFLRYGFAGPLLFFFLYLTVFISKNLNIPSEPTMAGPDSFILFSNSGSFLDYLFLVVLLWASIFLSRSLSIAGATQVVGYFRDITRGDKGMKVITKLVDQGGALAAASRGGKILHRWTGAPLAVKSDLKGPFRGGEGGARAVARAFQPALKVQTEATQKALESLLNPQAVGRVLSIIDAKRKGGELGQFGGDLQEIGKMAALSFQDPGEFVRTLWRRFEPPTAPTGSFWKDAKTLNQEINKQIDSQERVRTTFNDLGARNDKIMDFQAKDLNEKEAQIYKLAWTGSLPEFFNTKLGKAYSPDTLAAYVKTNFGESQGGRVAEKLKMIGEVKKDPSLSVASWNEKKSKFEVAAKPQEAPKIDPKDLRIMAPQSLLVKNEKGQYSGFNESGMRFLKEMSASHVREIGQMRQDTVKAIAEAFKSTQKTMGKEFAKQIGGGGFGAVQAETIKAIGKAQMQGPFHVEQVQAPHANISLGQEFLNKIAGRAFASKKMDTGAVGIITPETKSEPATPEQKAEQAKIAGRSFAQKKTEAERVVRAEESAFAPDGASADEEEDVSNLKDKQNFLMLGEKKAEA